MQVLVYPDVPTMSQAAADDGAALIRQALAERGEANLIVATGASQLTMLSRLSQAEGVDWRRVVGFHLDEYIGLPFAHKGSFRGYLWKHFVSQLPAPLKQFHFLDGEGDAQAECRRVGEILASSPIDVAFVGIGENGHLA
ncbi:MAG: 6-phosphogluconolactonase, partial [Planctomycetales bacterium]|nr:6-phosphogluconolactonase [Planctomycetales bacterium]